MTARNSRENQSIECMRLICSVSILFIHCGFPLPEMLRGYAMAIARFAVPFLILLSGWYVDHDGGSRRAKKKLRDLIRIIFIGGSICFVWNCLNSYLRYGSWSSWLAAYWNWPTLRRFLIFNRAVVINSVFYYFFLMLYVYGIFIVGQRLRAVKTFCHIMLLLLVGGIAIAEFSSFPWYYAGNFLFVGLPFFFLGYRLRDFKNRLVRVRGKEWLLALLGIGLTSLEYYLVGSQYLYIGAILLAVAFMIFCMNHETLSCPKLLVKAGTYLSLPVIVIHCEVRDTLKILISWPSDYGFPLLVLLLSVLLGIGYQKIRRRL